MRHIMIMLAICFAMVIGYQQTTPAMESSNVDVREVVHTVKELNNISDSGNLTPGTKIKVPVYKTDSPTRAMDYMAQN